MKIAGLYLITDDDRDGRLAERVRQALAGGARIVQYRDKCRPAAERLAAARQLAGLCRQAGALFLVKKTARSFLSLRWPRTALGMAPMPNCSVEPFSISLAQRNNFV